MRTQDLARRTREGERRACARFISLIEDRDPTAMAQLQLLPAIEAFRIGVTGPPGGGKSSLVDHLIHEVRASNASVGVLAVDPSSPLSGGALLGDRIRMQDHAADAGVFIRSMGSRGHLGGLAASCGSACRILEAYGCDVVILETVGAGQCEVEIAALASTVLLVVSPHAGDGIQILKAGIMEIADFFVINKSDLPGAQAVATEIRTMLGESPYFTESDGFEPSTRVCLTHSLAPLAQSGVPELWRLLDCLRSTRQTPPMSRSNRAAVFSEALAIVCERLEAVDHPEDYARGVDTRLAAETWLRRAFAPNSRGPRDAFEA